MAAFSRGVSKSTVASLDDPYHTFFGTAAGPVVPVLQGLHRVLGAARLSDGAVSTLYALYGEYAVTALHSQDNVDPSGWLDIRPSQEKLARELGKDRTTVFRHLGDLEALGALRKIEDSAGRGFLKLRPPANLVAHLMERGGVQSALEKRFPEPPEEVVETPFSGSRNYVAFAGTQKPTNDLTPSQALTWSEGWDDTVFAVWVEAEQKVFGAQMKSMYSKIAALRTAQAVAEQQSASVKEKREAKAPSQRMGNGRKKSAAPARTDTAPVLLREFQTLVAFNFPTGFSQPSDMKSLGQMKQLLDRFGESDVRTLTVFVTDADNWKRVKDKWPKIELFQPTPGWMLAWSESLLQWIKAGTPAAAQRAEGPKRSGGAELYERTTTDARGRPTF